MVQKGDTVMISLGYGITTVLHNLMLWENKLTDIGVHVKLLDLLKPSRPLLGYEVYSLTEYGAGREHNQIAPESLCIGHLMLYLMVVLMTCVHLAHPIHDLQASTLSFLGSLYWHIS